MVSKLQQKLEKLERGFEDAKKDFAHQCEAFEAGISQRLQQEKLKWSQEQSISTQPAPHPLRTDSASFSRKNATVDYLSHGADRPVSRRSGSPFHGLDSGTPLRQNSVQSFSQLATNDAMPDTPSIQTPDHEDYLDTPSARGVNDLISVSTVNAGPSVQLVERMSANVRRLESERASLKDELSRLTEQRDEARQEIVSLMREVEGRRACDERIEALEREVTDINDRYETTLEMLGEKSETVQELQADIADLKKIYRELVDSTMK